MTVVSNKAYKEARVATIDSTYLPRAQQYKLATHDHQHGCNGQIFCGIS